jgi:hypothetical protein
VISGINWCLMEGLETVLKSSKMKSYIYRSNRFLKVMTSWSFGSLNLRISTLLLLGVLGKCYFDVGHMKSCKIYYHESDASHKSPSHDESNLKVVQNLKTTYTPSHKVNIITSKWNLIIFLRDNRYTPLHYIYTQIYGLVHPIFPWMHGQLTIFIFPYCKHKMHSNRF